MKTTYLFLFISLILVFASCKDDSADNPVFGEKEIPYIYSNLPETITATAGELLNYSVLVSPADGSVKVQWLLDGEVISTTTQFEYTFNEAGTHTLRFEASRNGVDNYRQYPLTVK